MMFAVSYSLAAEFVFAIGVIMVVIYLKGKLDGVRHADRIGLGRCETCLRQMEITMQSKR